MKIKTNIINNKKIIILFLLFAIMVLNFSFNVFTSQDEMIGGKTFREFQKDSEALVLSKMDHDSYNNKSKYGLSCTYIGDNKIETKLPENSENVVFKEYVSQVGIQGYIFTFMHNNLHIPISYLHILCSMLLASVLIAICTILYKKYSKTLGIIFYITFLLSPWVIAFARNLYWVEFTWFLPCLLALMLSLNYSKKKIYVPLIGIAILGKCLCGYEYISSIMLLTISFFIIDFIQTNGKKERKEIIKTIIAVSIACIIGFTIAIIIHSYMRGDGNLLTGLANIYKKDIARRTLNISGSEQFENTVYESSIKATTFSTVKKYFTWHTNIVLGIEGKYFRIMVFLALMIVLYNLIKRKENSKRDLSMFVVFLATTMSWYILGKSHSYIHVHMNYVLWYFGFIQTCLYLLIKEMVHVIKYISCKEVEKKSE